MTKIVLINNLKSTSLDHSGVKGMKWGIRKDRKGGKSSSPLKSLSDEELQTRVNRLQLEKRYKDLSSEDKKSPASLANGLKITAAILTSAWTITNTTKNITNLIKKNKS